MTPAFLTSENLFIPSGRWAAVYFASSRDLLILRTRSAAPLRNLPTARISSITIHFLFPGTFGRRGPAICYFSISPARLSLITPCYSSGLLLFSQLGRTGLYITRATWMAAGDASAKLRRLFWRGILTRTGG